MRHYDPEVAPRSKDWLSLDERQRLRLAEAHHRATHVKVPSIKAHAAIHLMVENQIAEGVESVVRAIARIREGLSRHEAIHAVGSVLAEHFFDAMKTSDQDLSNTALPVAVVVLDALSNELSALLPLVPMLERELLALEPKSCVRVAIGA